MALVYQNDANGDMSGMTLAIYQELDNQLAPPLQQDIADAEDEETKNALEQALADARQVWEKMSYAIAKGVIEHIKENMEIHDIETEGEVDGNPVVFTQVSGTGRIE